MIAVGIIGAALIFIFQQGIYSKEGFESQPESPSPAIQSEKPTVISTSPSPLNESIILPTQKIELTFNYPLENTGELKIKIDPPIELKITLSSDRKTATLTPIKPFELGRTFSLTIKGGTNETKFDGGKRLDQDYSYNFRTIEYRGI